MGSLRRRLEAKNLLENSSSLEQLVSCNEQESELELRFLVDVDKAINLIIYFEYRIHSMLPYKLHIKVPPSWQII